MFSCKIYKLKKDKVSEWKKWCSKIDNSLQEEALRTLKEEESSLETFLIFEINNEFYTIGFGIGKFLAINQDRKLNTMHMKKKKECFEKIIPVENLYSLDITREIKCTTTQHLEESPQ